MTCTDKHSNCCELLLIHDLRERDTITPCGGSTQHACTAEKIPSNRTRTTLLRESERDPERTRRRQREPERALEGEIGTERAAEVSSERARARALLDSVPDF